MADVTFLKGKNVHLRALVEDDANGPYPNWFNDEAVCYGNMHHQFPYSIDDAIKYIRHANNGSNHLIQAITLVEGGTHVGNIALDKINYINRTAELSIIIGDTSYWGKGYGKEASRLICNHGFWGLNLNRISCGTLETNVSMQKLAEHLGMRREGLRRQAAFKHGRYVDIIEYGVLRDEYDNRFGSPSAR